MCIGMIIGFTQRRQNVSEGGAEGTETFLLSINVATERQSEREHEMIFTHLGGTATVVSFTSLTSDYDARFGGQEVDPLTQFDSLLPLESTVRPLPIEIRNDFITEAHECFTIGISPFFSEGDRDLFRCNPDTESNFFCKHTICIINDDGKSQ